MGSVVYDKIWGRRIDCDNDEEIERMSNTIFFFGIKEAIFLEIEDFFF